MVGILTLIQINDLRAHAEVREIFTSSRVRLVIFRSKLLVTVRNRRSLKAADTIVDSKLTNRITIIKVLVDIQFRDTNELMTFLLIQPLKLST